MGKNNLGLHICTIQICDNLRNWMLISSPWISKGLSATSLSYPRWRFILQMMWSVGQLKRLKKAITIPVSTKHVYNIYTMSGQRRSRTLAIFTKKLCDKNYGKELMSDIFTRNEMNGVLGHLSAHIGPNWGRRTFWGWWDEWGDTALQTHDSKFKPWASDTEYATSWSRRLFTILNLYEWAGKKHFVSLKLEGQSGVRTRDLRLSKPGALTAAAPGSIYIREDKLVLLNRTGQCWASIIGVEPALIKTLAQYIGFCPVSW